ncbi:MAG: DUF3465 domain-containing protein [Methylotenera sp.]|nr:DUF3465 domain-containing protein [Methylotenera sp.]
MKKHIFLLIILSLLFACKQNNVDIVDDKNAPEQVKPQAGLQNTTPVQSDNAALIQAFHSKKSDIFVEGAGIVKKILPDDNKGSRHQKFLVTISVEQTLLFAHNIDLAPVVPLAVGDAVQFRGEYVYNPKGGVMHWTHRDPQQKIEGGWIKHNDNTYK